MDKTGSHLKKKKLDRLADKVSNFNNDWLSLLGWNKGITGLASDFVLNYFKRDAFHNKNGPFINSVKIAAHVIASGKKKMKKQLPEAIRNMARDGLELFPTGSLHDVFVDLNSMVEEKAIVDAFMEQKDVDLNQVSDGLQFLVTDLDAAERERKELEQMDDEL